MSNQSLLLHLREAAIEYESERLSSNEFSALLNNIIEALEAVPYSVIREMRTFRHRIEISGFHEEDKNISDRKAVVAQLRLWIEAIESRKIQK